MYNRRFPFAQIATVQLLILILSACYRAAPVSAPARGTVQPAGGSSLPAGTLFIATLTPAGVSPQATKTPNVLAGKEVTFQDIRFLLPGELGIGAGSQLAPATEILGETYPAHIEFRLAGYPSRNTSFEPLIRVYPLSELGVVASSSAGQLKDLLAEQPAELPATLPLLPALPAGQLVHAAVRYLSFGGGSGVRLLTQFAQSSWPVNNEGLVYVFQGLTSDERYYVSAFLPVHASFLPDKVDDPDKVPEVDGVAYPKFDSDDFDLEYARYQQAVTQRLEAATAGELEPSLSLLDELIQSLDARTDEQAAEDVTCPGAPPTRLRVDGFAYVEPEPPLPNNVRREPGKDNPLVGEIEAGAAMRILEGPKCADGWVWWRVSALDTDVEGWTAEGDQQSYWLVPCESRNECKP